MISHVIVEVYAQLLARIFRFRRIPIVYTSKADWFESFPNEREIFNIKESQDWILYGRCMINRNAIFINLEDIDKFGREAEFLVFVILEELMHLKHPKFNEKQMAKLMSKYGY